MSYCLKFIKKNVCLSFTLNFFKTNRENHSNLELPVVHVHKDSCKSIRLLPSGKTLKMGHSERVYKIYYYEDK